MPRPGRIVGAVAPYADEAPSSWLARTAAWARGRPDQLHARLGAPPELDLGIPAPLAETFAQRTGLSLCDLSPLAPGRACQGYTESDIVPTDLETGLRAPACGLCLAQDAVEGRDHYIRWPWVFAWTTTCWRHGTELTEVTALDRLPGRLGSQARLRLSRAVDEITDPFRIKPMRAPRARRAPAGVIALEMALERHRLGLPVIDVWSFSKTWPQTRQVLLDLADFLAARAPASKQPLFTYLYAREGEHTSWWTTLANRPGILLRLDAHRRAELCEALSCVLLDPRRFQIIELHREGAAGFYRRLRASRWPRLGALGRMARLDPLTLLLSEASQETLVALERASRRWPARLADRLAAASAAAI